MVKKILSINHSDALAKTGVQVDLREFQKLDCFGFSAISAFFINSDKKYQIVSPALLLEQLESILSISSMDAIKINYSVPLDYSIKEFFLPIYKETPIIFELNNRSEDENSFSDLAKIITLTADNHKIKDIHQYFNDYCKQPNQFLAIPDKYDSDKSYLYDGSDLYELHHTQTSLSNFLTAECAKDSSLSSLLTETNKKRDEL